MKKKIMLAIILIAKVAGSINAQTKESPVITEKNTIWSQIIKQSKREQKIILLQLYSIKCISCENIEKEIFQNDTIRPYINSNFIVARMQIDAQPIGSSANDPTFKLTNILKNKFHIKNSGAFLFFDSDGNLIHREQEFVDQSEFIKTCLIAQNPNLNYASAMRRFSIGKMQGVELLNFAILLKRYSEDSLSLLAGNGFKEELKKVRTGDQITGNLAIFLSEFPNLYEPKDPLIKYIFLHKEKTDSTLKMKGFSESIVDQITTNKILNRHLSESIRKEEKDLDWPSVSREIASLWDQETADRIVLNGRIKWYLSKSNWDSLAKYQIKKIDQTDYSANVLNATMVNNFIWDIIFSRIQDTSILKRAIIYLQKITQIYPAKDEFIDTYANVLYKFGYKNEAILAEQKALALAIKKNDKESIELYNETLKKMTTNIPTW